MDATDCQLAALLQSNARLTYEQLGDAVGLSTPAAYQRVRKLEEQGILVGYHGQVSPAAVGRPVLVFARVHPGPTSDVTGLVQTWDVTPEVLECHAVAGTAGYLIKLRLKNVHELGPHLDHARKAGCSVSADVVITTAFERWSVPVS
ncbi:MAG: hypothetical protein AMS21_13095 [Gemmatimonas sp. SG8_38_2]|nr:MAG: hypothetical protein AMS21_13095 [Gemmatimonas sp. SG8_38_2]